MSVDAKREAAYGSESTKQKVRGVKDAAERQRQGTIMADIGKLLSSFDLEPDHIVVRNSVNRTSPICAAAASG